MRLVKTSRLPVTLPDEGESGAHFAEGNLAALFRIKNSRTLGSCNLRQFCRRRGRHPGDMNTGADHTLAKPGGVLTVRHQGRRLSKASSRQRDALFWRTVPSGPVSSCAVFRPPWSPPDPAAVSAHNVAGSEGTPTCFSGEPRPNTSLTWRLFPDLLPGNLSGDSPSWRK